MARDWAEAPQAPETPSVQKVTPEPPTAQDAPPVRPQEAEGADASGDKVPLAQDQSTTTDKMAPPVPDLKSMPPAERKAYLKQRMMEAMEEFTKPIAKGPADPLGDIAAMIDDGVQHQRTSQGAKAMKKRKTLRKRMEPQAMPTPEPEEDIQIIDYHPVDRDNVAAMTREEKLEWAARELGKDPDRVAQARRIWLAEKPERDLLEDLPLDEEMDVIMLNQLARELNDSSIAV